MSGRAIPWQRVGLLVLLGGALAVTVLAAQGYTAEDDAADRVAAVAGRLALAQDPPPTPGAGATPGRGDENGEGPGWQGGRPSRGGGLGDDASPAGQAVARIRDRHLFAPAPAEAFRNVQGVLGTRVLYPGGQSFTVGDNAMGATITAVGSGWVEFEHDGGTERIHVFEGGGSGGGGGHSSGGGGGDGRWSGRRGGGGEFTPPGDGGGEGRPRRNRSRRNRDNAPPEANAPEASAPEPNAAPEPADAE